MSEDPKLTILKEIRDRQRESLELQREQFEFIKGHYDRAEAIHSKAEKLQDRASQMFKIIAPIIIVLLGFLLFIVFGKFL